MSETVKIGKTIPEGAEVQVTVQGTFSFEIKDGRDYFRVTCDDGEDYYLPVVDMDAIEVLSPPLPPEPPVGAYIEVRVDLAATPDVYVRLANYAHYEPPWDGWFSLRLMGEPPIDWAELHKDGAKVTRLYRADEQGPCDWCSCDCRCPRTGTCAECGCSHKRPEQPQEKYEQASRPDGHRMWHCSCGLAVAAAPGLKPGACVRCGEPDAWTPLYRRFQR